jgi:hypothetical protein
MLMVGHCIPRCLSYIGLPEPYIYTVYDCIPRVGQNRIYIYIYVYIHRIFGDYQAKNTVCTPYIYGSGQPYVYLIISQEVVNWGNVQICLFFLHSEAGHPLPLDPTGTIFASK